MTTGKTPSKPGDAEAIRLIAMKAVSAALPGPAGLILKGGNALSLVYGIGGRTSLDLDYSLRGDFPDVRQAEIRIVECLVAGFRNAGYHLFDVRFLLRPPEPHESWWGGYEVLFKLIPAGRSGPDVERSRRSATVIGPAQERVFRVQISRHEFVGDVAVRLVDDTSILVYSPALIAAEKVRAICQQMPEYPYARYPHPRARDFFDIHSICTEASTDLAASGNRELLEKTFEAKRVPIGLLARIETTREFHRVDWPSVEGSVRSLAGDFDFYFDFVVAIAKRLTA